MRRAIVLLIGMLTACGTDKGFTPSTDPHALLKSVELAERGYNLSTIAPYDTVQLHVTARLADGNVATGVVRYRSTDSALHIDSTGLLHVRSPLARARATIYAAMTVEGVTRTDSAKVTVVTTQPLIPVRLVVSDTDPSSGEPWNIPRARAWPHTELEGYMKWSVFDGNGNPLPDFVVTARSTDTTVLSVPNRENDIFYGWVEVVPFSVGNAWVRVSTYAYGRIFRDSVDVQVNAPQLYGISSAIDDKVVDGTVRKELHFHPDSLNVPSGADVTWYPPPICTPTIPGTVAPCKGPWINIDFDEPQYALDSRIPPAYGTTPDVYASVYNSYADIQRLKYNMVGGHGNIASFGAILPDSTTPCRDVVPINCRPPGSTVFGNTAGESRRFVRPGHYHYHTAQGASGVVVVE